MLKGRFVVGLTLLSALMMSSAASGALYFDIWPATVDGSMNMHPTEGYAIGSEGNYRFTKSYHHMPFLGFEGKSDGPDGIPQDKQKGGVNDSDDGILMADWLVGKKAFHAAVYVRNSSVSTCDPYAAAGTYLNDPVTIVGFRVANDGLFVDRGTGAKGQLTPPNGFGGCCAGYLSPLLEGGENAPAAWRMGAPNVDRAGVKGYSEQGAINEADPQAEWYKVSTVDSLHPEAEVKIGSAGFGTAGFGGYSTNSGIAGTGHFAFDYLVQKSDAMIINSTTMTEADCTGFAGEEEPRDFDGDLNYGEGWYAEIVDRAIIQAMVTPNENTGIVECKGIVFSSASVALYINPSMFGRDQGGGQSGAYLAITATLNGDGPNNDGCADVVDLLDLVGAFGSMTGDVNWQPEVDWNSDGYVDVVDLLTLVENFGLCVE